MKTLKLEFAKSRGRGLLLISLAMLSFLVAWKLWAFRNPDASDRQWGWMLLLYNLPLVRGIVFPIFVAVIASKLADLEYKSGCLRTLETIQPPSSLYRAKFLCGSVYVMAVTVLEFAAMLWTGHLFGFWGQMDKGDFALSFLFAFVTGLEMYAISLALSMNIPNQAVPLCIGVGGSFVGLLMMLVPGLTVLRLLLPWAHTSALVFIGMDWSKEGGFAGMHHFPVDWFAFLITVLGIVLAYAIGQRQFKRMEV